MADPVIVDCPEADWTLVASNVKNGNVWKKDKSPNKYLQTYVETGNPAPTEQEIGQEISGDGLPIAASMEVDVYIMPLGADGSVRVDL